jgi:serine/threonine protein kinase
MGSSVSVPTNIKKTYPPVPNIPVNNTIKNTNNDSNIPQPYREKEAERMKFKNNFEYRSHILKLKTPNGKLDKIRKIANKSNNSIYNETKEEIEIYKKLSKEPDSANYILPYEASGESEESIYLNLKYIEGNDISSFYEKPRSQRETAKYLLSGIKALYWLFSKGYIHGDVKLDNLFFLPDGSTRLLDLGRAIALDTLSKRDAVYEVNDIINMFLVRDEYGNVIRPLIPYLDTREFKVNNEELRKLRGSISKFLDTFFIDFISFIEERIPRPTKGGRRRTNAKTKAKRNKANTKKKNK